MPRKPTSLPREKKRKKLDIVELTPEARQEHMATWQKVQTDFVDAPTDAVGRAERLVTRVMRERGYPIDDFDQRAADISVDHPDIVENYRGAHAIYQSQRGETAPRTHGRRSCTTARSSIDCSDPIPTSSPTSRTGEHRRQTHDHA